jgi:hypothetical protein
MAEVTLRLRINPETGKKDIIISMRSDEDALPHEHEQQHRAIVEKLIHGGLVKAADLGKIVVEREEGENEPALPSGNAPEGERKAQQSGH